MNRTHWGLKGRVALCASAFSVIATGVCACSWLQGDIDDKEVAELDKGLMAENRQTPFDEALLNLNTMIAAYDIPSAAIQCKNIGNETADKGALPSDLYTMISTALNKIGRKVVFIPYDARYVMAEATTGGKIERRFPEAVIAGGITGFDKDMIEKDRKGEASGAWAGAQGSARYNAAEGVSRITLDLNMLDYSTQAAVPGVLVSNAIVVRKDKLGWAVSGSYMGCGGSFASSVKTKQGVHAALRFLVEFSVLELVGKYSQVPYWKCLPGANEDTAMCQRLLDLIRSLPDNKQALLVKQKLFLHGVEGIDRDSQTISSSELSLIQQSMREHACAGLPELYVELWKTVPVKEALARIAKDNKRRQAEFAQRAEEQRQLQAVETAKAAERERLNKENVAKYGELVKQADTLLSNGSQAKAKELYSAAACLFPGEVYPKERIAAINALVAESAARIQSSEKALAEGDRLFAMRDYEAARKSYAEALRLTPDSATAKTKMDETARLLRKKAPTGLGLLNESDFKDDNN